MERLKRDIIFQTSIHCQVRCYDLFFLFFGGGGRGLAPGNVFFDNEKKTPNVNWTYSKDSWNWIFWHLKIEKMDIFQSHQWFFRCFSRCWCFCWRVHLTHLEFEMSQIERSSCLGVETRWSKYTGGFLGPVKPEEECMQTFWNPGVSGCVIHHGCFVFSSKD